MGAWGIFQKVISDSIYNKRKLLQAAWYINTT